MKRVICVIDADMTTLDKKEEAEIKRELVNDMVDQLVEQNMVSFSRDEFDAEETVEFTSRVIVISMFDYFQSVKILNGMINNKELRTRDNLIELKRLIQYPL